MLPGATDAGLFFKPAQMLSIGKSTKNPQAAAKVINFLLNSKEGWIRWAWSAACR
jgi:oligogalacturonide transport system substrate-binding protein